MGWLLSLKRRAARLRALNVMQWRAMAASLVLVPAVEIALHRRGFLSTARYLGKRSDRPSVAPDLEASRRLSEAVAIIAGRRVVGAPCLSRSLVVWFLLRRHGIDAEVVIGAEPPAGGVLPAHAWVEVDGVPVNDVPTVRDRYGSFGVKLPRLGG